MTPKNKLKRYLSTIFTKSGLYASCRYLNKKKHVILTFHKVHLATDKAPEFDSCPSISTDLFTQVVSYLNDDFKIVSLKCLCQNLSSPLPLAAITFDDGWRDNYQNAFPLLKKHKLPATIFMTTGKIGSAAPFWQQELGFFFHELRHLNNNTSDHYLRDVLGVDGPYENLSHVYLKAVTRMKSLGDKERQQLLSKLPRADDNYKKERCFLSEKEIREMAKSNIEFGSHSHNHSILTNQKRAEIIEELNTSKVILENLIGEEVNMIAYPNGGVSEDVVLLAKKAGYNIACTTVNSRIVRGQNLMELPRIDAEWDGLCSHDGKLSKTVFNWVVK